MPRDEIKTCNDQGIPLKDFKLAFCDRCLNADCTRSQMAGDKFSQRTSTWVERLFTQTPRMDSTDPRFSKLSAQKFIEVPGRGVRTPEVGSGADWVDPLEEKPPTTERMPQTVPQDESGDEEVTNPMSQPPEGVAAAPLTEAPPADRHNPLIGSHQPGQLNTPRRQGQMLGSVPGGPTIPATVSDSWDAPPKPPPEKNVVKPGARIRFSDPKKSD